jgi:hypothetical protein
MNMFEVQHVSRIFGVFSLYVCVCVYVCISCLPACGSSIQPPDQLLQRVLYNVQWLCRQLFSGKPNPEDTLWLTVSKEGVGGSNVPSKTFHPSN